MFPHTYHTSIPCIGILQIELPIFEFTLAIVSGYWESLSLSFLSCKRRIKVPGCVTMVIKEKSHWLAHGKCSRNDSYCYYDHYYWCGRLLRCGFPVNDTCWSSPLYKVPSHVKADHNHVTQFGQWGFSKCERYKQGLDKHIHGHVCFLGKLALGAFMWKLPCCEKV